jgi:2-isopropylmalate synthase
MDLDDCFLGFGRECDDLSVDAFGRKLEIYDCTLREGEQAKSGISFENRLKLCSSLDDLGVDYIELGWPVGFGEVFDSFLPAIENAKNAKIVAFGSTSRSDDCKDDLNLRSIVDCGVKYACIFGKADINHVESQLRISGEKNLEKIVRSIEFLRDNGLKVFFDAEHFYDGFKSDPFYALDCVLSAKEAGAKRVVLCDTNGGALPSYVFEVTKRVKDVLEDDSSLGIHLHDDCGFAMASSFSVLPFVKMVQGTINGYGERVGNLNLTTFISNYVDKFNGELNEIDLRKLRGVNDESYRVFGLFSDGREPYVGSRAFAHRGGVHINGVSRGASYEHANPEDFGNERVIVLNSLGGVSSVLGVAKELGFYLDRDDCDFKNRLTSLFSELNKYERDGYDIGSNRAEQYLLLSKHFGLSKSLFDLVSVNYSSSWDGSFEKSCCNLLIDFDGERLSGNRVVDGGPVHAAFDSLKEVVSKKYPYAERLHLNGYESNIAQYKEQESVMRVEVKFRNGEEFSTVGVHDNILNSSLIALLKGFRYHILRGGD